jgi:hypothetical protein
MGTILTDSILSRAQEELNDDEGVRWLPARLVDFLNEGQRAIVELKPTAYVVGQSVQLAAGTTQALPSGGVQLIDIPRNMGLDGATPGRAIRIVKRTLLDAKAPRWHQAEADPEVRHFMYDADIPKRFLVYPPQPASGQGYVEVLMAAIPPATGLGQPIAVDDIYDSALLDYVLYRAFAKDTEFAADQGRSGAHYQAFAAQLGAKIKAEAATNPNNKPN